MTNAEARFNNSLRPRKPEGSLGRTAQDVHLDSHTAPELWNFSINRLLVKYYRKFVKYYGWEVEGGGHGWRKVCVCVCGEVGVGKVAL